MERDEKSRKGLNVMLGEDETSEGVVSEEQKQKKGHTAQSQKNKNKKNPEKIHCSKAENKQQDTVERKQRWTWKRQIFSLN